VDECCARAEDLIKNMRDHEISEVQQRHDYCMHADAAAGSNELIEEDEISNISKRERSSTYGPRHSTLISSYSHPDEED
jgi:hypothetical protein